MPLSTDFTKVFPLKTVLEIVSHLDTESIVPFLNAFPSMKKHAIRVFFHKNVPYFFDIDDVYKVVNYFPPDLHKEWESKPIRLVETSWVAEHLRSVTLYQPTCFLFLYPSTNLACSVQQFCQMLEEYGCKWRIGPMTRFSIDGTYCKVQTPGLVLVSPPDMSPSLTDKNYYTSLVTLRVEDAPIIEGLRFERLRELALIYTSATHVRPIIREMDAPKVIRLVISFHGLLPKISGTLIGYNREILSKKKGKRYPVKEPSWAEISDARFSDCDLESTLRQGLIPALDPTQTTECNLSFIRNFRAATIIGVPLYLLEGISLHRVLKIHLRITHPEYCNTSVSLDLPSLETAVLHATKTGCVLPRLVSPLLRDILLTVTAPGVDLTNMWHLDTEFLYDLVLYFHPRALKDLKPAAYSISHDTWNRLLCPVLRSANNISIMCAEMPFLTPEEGLKADVLHSKKRVRVHLRPLLTTLQKKQKRLCVDMITISRKVPWYGNWFQYVISPIFRTEEPFPEEGALLEFPNVAVSIEPNHHRSGCVAPITTGAYFRTCVFGGLVMTLPETHESKKNEMVRWVLEMGDQKDVWDGIEWKPVTLTGRAIP